MKKPWEMTQVYVNSKNAEIDFPLESKVEVIDGKPVYTYLTTLNWDGENKTFLISRKTTQFSQPINRLHKEVIQQALLESKSVPFNVLKEYAGEKWADDVIKQRLKQAIIFCVNKEKNGI